MTSPSARRSLLFVPGLRADRFAKALASGADMVCLDLEDAVPLARKAEARAIALSCIGGRAAGVETLLRINSPREPDGLRDLIALADGGGAPQGLLLPKVRDAAEVALVADVLSRVPTLAQAALHVLIETAAGLEVVAAIARAPRVASLMFGAVDLSVELRCAQTWEALLYARSRVAHAAAAAGIDALDVPSLVLDDPAGLEHDAKAAAGLGYTGKAAIHPNQVPTINRVFSPNPQEVARAKRILAAFAENKDGLLVVDGALIEAPVVKRMERLVARAAASGSE